MNVTIIALGTRGDVQPLLALAHSIQARGQRVRMVAGANFRAWIEQHGFEAATVSLDMQAVMQSTMGNEWIEHGTSPLKQAQVMKKLLNLHGLLMMQETWNACQDADALISGFTSDIYAASIAEKLRIKQISALLQPALLATRNGMASAAAPFPRRESWFNYLSGKLFLEPFPWRLMGAINSQFRQQTLGLPAQTRQQNRQALAQMLVVQGYSAEIVPHPADWPANIHTTGYWFLDAAHDWQPSAALQAFLAAGEPPIYVGFGSMTGNDPQALTRLIVAAVDGRRVVVQAGWAGLGALDLPANVFLLDSAPHNWLFAWMSAIVHHGGAGTTAASVRTGVPTVIIPHFADQPFWGRRIAALGIGPQPIPRPKLTAPRLANALDQALNDPAMRRRAHELGERIRAENGVQVADELIAEFLAA